tara:strand:+ start:10876 stop:11337 length:462 start_codon:yes stop_codon:yes gene_type:complete
MTKDKNTPSFGKMTIPDRMKCINFSIKVDNRKLTVLVDYIENKDKSYIITAAWLKLRPQDSYLDRELRASGKMMSRCFQRGETVKTLGDTLSQDNIAGVVANYLKKNIVEILAGVQPTLEEKQKNISTDPYRIKEKPPEPINIAIETDKKNDS